MPAGLVDRVRRDLRFYGGLARLLRRIRVAKPGSHWTLADVLEREASRAPDRPAILFEGRAITYAEWESAANAVARWALALGIRRGDVIALLMENRPEFLFVWAGLAKIGAATALLNSSQSGKSLAHGIATSGARHIIVGAELGAAYRNTLAHLTEPPYAWSLGGRVLGTRELDEFLTTKVAPVGREARRGLSGADTCFYVFTSGTTGLPKAARISHARVAMMMNAFSALARANAKSRMYIPLPLYHTSGGICAVGAVLTVGGTIILRRKFSVHAFWDDCVRYGATHFIYIGELCRYLLNAPAHPQERMHRLQGAIGNGLRPDIWTDFQTRFAIPDIVEFYGATEGNVSLFNFDGKPGAVGRIPRWMKSFLHMRLVAFDDAAGEPARNARGRCRECRPGEIGEAIGRISETATRARFEGYTEQSDTQRKILRDVFKTGDAWFRTGDLLRQDEAGYFYFVDRVGDTFRWKGENVATSEVSEALSHVPGVREANVYGVAIPGLEGRAGMAALTVDGELDLDRLADALVAALAPFARPVFLRVKDELEATATFKHKKTDLVREGFDPAAISDPLYFHDPEAGRFVPLSEERYRAIVGGKVRL